MNALNIRIGIGTSWWVKLVTRRPFFLNGLMEAFWKVMDGVSVELTSQIRSNAHLGKVNAMSF